MCFISLYEEDELGVVFIIFTLPAQRGEVCESVGVTESRALMS